MDIKGVADFGRRAAAEGAVLLKNNNSALPVRDEAVSVFGRTQINYYKSGTGSGGAVNVRRVVNILDGFRENPHIYVNEELAKKYEKWVIEYAANYNNTFEADFSDREVPLNEEDVIEASKKSKKAIVVIGRVSGEAYDNTDTEGSFRLTQKERTMLTYVCRHFKTVIAIVNSGNIFDMKWADEFPISALLLIWQGGSFGGKAAADIVSGDITPSGKLTDTIAYNYSDYPSCLNFGAEDENIYTEDIYVGYRYFETFKKDRVLYPFGFGLSYTSFDVKILDVYLEDKRIFVKANVKNIGKTDGKEVIQIYFKAPSKKLGRPERELIAFKKTACILPLHDETLILSFNTEDMAAYDDSGVTGYKSCFVMEDGSYEIYAGTDVRNAKKIFTYTLDKTVVVKRLTQACAPIKPFKRLVNKDGEMAYEDVPLNDHSVEERILKNLPKALEMTSDKGYRLLDAADNKVSMDAFVAQLDEDSLISLARGEGMLSPKVTSGTASCFGGVTDKLNSFGIPPCCTADGPSGIRMDCGELATNLPNGTLLACMWNPELVEKLFEMESRELMLNKIDIQLGPGLNIHRNPLCGRNFEYFSEDPLVTGINAAANIRGIQSRGCGAAAKHFACNNQETARGSAMSVVSERALREIYLKAFEIVVKESSPKSVMTAYNPLNGYQTASNYELTTVILREEWGFKGFVMSDWWAVMNTTPKTPPSPTQRAAMVRAGNNVYMVVENNSASDNSIDDLKRALKEGNLTIAELQKNASDICSVISGLPAMKKEYDSSPIKNCYFPYLDGLSVNGEELSDFDPMQLDYYIEGEADIKAFGKYPFTVNKYSGITEIIVSDGTQKSIYKVISIKKNSQKDGASSVSMQKNFVNNNTSIICDIDGKPGSTFEFPLHINETHHYRISVYASSDASDLAQLGIFINVQDKNMAISMRGSNGKMEKSEYTYGFLESGDCVLKMTFGNTNVSDINVKFLQIENADHIVNK